MQLLKESEKLFDEISSTASLGVIITNKSLSNSKARLRAIENWISKMLKVARDARSKYMEKFEEERNHENAYYSNEHRNGLSPISNLQ